MGLLDDAIREHLELKRQRGADPDEVDRQEHAALAPPHEGESKLGASDLDAEGERVSSSDVDDAGTYDPAPPERSNDLQETAEIDMRTVLEGMDSEAGSAWLEADGETGAGNTAPTRVERD